jgi:hypothetical protein
MAYEMPLGGGIHRISSHRLAPGLILRSATKLQRPSPPNSPQWATGSAHLNRCADRPLLPPRKRAIVTHRLWFQVDERRGSEQGEFLAREDGVDLDQRVPLGIQARVPI